MKSPAAPLDDLALAFVRRHGDDCAFRLTRWWQTAWYAAVVAAVLLGALYRWDVVFAAVTLVFAFWHFSIVLFRVAVVAIGSSGRGLVRVAPGELAGLDRSSLPVYTILVPLYREANVAGTIVHSLRRLEYPPDRLDIKLLLEEDDALTLDAVRGAALDTRFQVIVVPHSMPKTKPKACNYGLREARGEFCVIYDAEDRPDPDQLLKAVVAFRALPPRVACLQARLNHYNTRQNLLTRWFTIEYSTTFDLYLPGLVWAGIPMPLGGTSNHFRTEVLRECEGWDPFNVTEDCDLGVRIYRMGYATRMLESTTWEEANPRLWNWIRQRSRWVKGFFQTHLSHMRNPFRTVRQLGPWGLFGFLLCVGGSSLMMVTNVLHWIVGGIYGWLVVRAVQHGYGLWDVLKGPRQDLPGSSVWPMVYYGPKEDPLWSSLSVAFFVVACLLLAANLAFVAMHVLACLHRRFYALLPYALLMPLYWVLISVGAWKGFIQLLTRPQYWEKTHHGLDAAGPVGPSSSGGG